MCLLHKTHFVYRTRAEQQREQNKTKQKQAP
jgi:hypothetical protein